jgi:hypothetical protein
VSVQARYLDDAGQSSTGLIVKRLVSIAQFVPANFLLLLTN